MLVDQVLKTDRIHNYIKHVFFENLASNFSLYNSTLEEYGELITSICTSDQIDLIDETTICDIRNYAIERISNYEAYSLHDFKIFAIIEEYYPSLINDDIKNEIATYFDEYQDEDAHSIDNWEHLEEIDDYASSVEELGNYFNINVYPTLKYLNEQKEAMADSDNEEDEDAYDKYRESRMMSKGDCNGDDSSIKNMFDSLKS